MDVSAIYSILNLRTPKYAMSTSDAASKVAARLLTNRDSDEDGYIANDDVPELSSDEFAKLDTDGDGVLNSSEITTAFQAQLDALTQLTQGGLANSRGALSVLKRSPAGLLMQASKTPSRSPSPATTSTASPSQSSETNTLNVTA